MDLALITLSPEFGGTAFGPFPAGNVALGCDAQQCHIALSAALGLDPVTAWVTLQDDGVHWLYPTRIGGGVFLFRGSGGSGGRGEELTGATQLHFGDAFSVGGAQGPRFVLQAPAQAKPSDPSGPAVDTHAQRVAGRSAGGFSLGGRGVPTAGAMGREVKRQISTQAMTHGSVSQLAQLATRLKSGTFMQPRYLIAGAVALMGVAATGCAGVLAVLQGLF